MIESKHTPEQIAEVNRYLGLPATPSVDTIIAEARRLHEAMVEINRCLFGPEQIRRGIPETITRIGELHTNPRRPLKNVQISNALMHWQAADLAADRIQALQDAPPGGVTPEEVNILIRHHTTEEARLRGLTRSALGA